MAQHLLLAASMSLRLCLLASLLITTSCFNETCDTLLRPPGEEIVLRDPDTGLCLAIGGASGDGQCFDSEDRQVDGTQEKPTALWATCEGACEGTDETVCLANPSCRASYLDDKTKPCYDLECLATSRQFNECWSVAPPSGISGSCPEFGADECSRHSECSSVHFRNEGGSIGPFIECTKVVTPYPGECYGQVFCFVEAPACPEGTLPGVADGCWSGYCIPANECEQLPVDECIAQSEAECVGSEKCAPIYEGVDCGCTASGCSCSEWIFDTCEDA